MSRFSSPRRRKVRKPPPSPPLPVIPGVMAPGAVVPEDPLVGSGAGAPLPPPPETSGPQGGARRRRTTLPRATRVWSRAIVWSLMAITVGGVIYGFIAKIETSVAARGQLRPIGGVASVTAPFTGIVEKVLIKEGDFVKRQQPLVQIRDKAASQQLTNLLKIQKLWQQETQVIATRLGFEPSPKEPASIDQLIANQRELTIREQAASVALLRSQSDYKSRVAEVVGLERQVKINEKIIIQMIPLVKEGAASELDLERQRERLEAVRTNLLKARGELTSSKLRINETRLQGSHIPAAERKQLYTSYNNARQQYIEVSSRIADQKQRLDLATLRSSLSGRVFDLQAKAGETIGPGRPALKIVPVTRLEARMEVTNKDIGFIHPGMKVDLRFDSFPSTEYGSIKGVIASVSADSLPPDPSNSQDHFIVKAKLSKQSLTRHHQNFPLRPGMSFNGLIILDARPAISVITDRFNSFFESTRSIR